MPRAYATQRTLALGLALSLAPVLRAAPGGDQLWRFYADFSVTVVEAVPDLSGNGGTDLLVGSGDDTLYLVEGRGAGRGAQLWAAPFEATVSAAAGVGDLDGDGRADVAAGDEMGVMQAISGGTGKPLWAQLAFGTVLSILAVPDVDGDKVPDVVFGSENDTLYCLKGKPGGPRAVAIWRFGAPIKRGRGGGDGAPPAKLAKGAVGAMGAMEATGATRPKDGPTGINSLALIRKGNTAHGVVAGVSNDTVYCLPPAGGVALWKAPMPGDAWKVVAFPDVDGDGIEEVLVANGADIGFLLKGADGAVIWSHALSMGGVSAAAAGDMTGDGKPDALLGDGGGKVHCVPGNASGANAAAAWVYDFKDTSTIHDLAALGDVDGDGRADLAAGTSHDKVAALSGKGALLWSVNMGGAVLSVTKVDDLDGNGADDVAAGTEMGFASAYQGFGTPSTLLRGPARTSQGIHPPRLRLSGGAGLAFGSRDLRGRGLPPPPSSAGRIAP